MKIAVVAEFLRDLPWSPSRWTATLMRGLAERGHELSLVIDGIQDVREHVLPANLFVRRPLRTVRNRQPIRFQRWARARIERLRAAGEVEATLSLTRLCEADLWMPIGPPSRREFHAIIRARSIATIGMETIQQPWLPAAILAERSGRRAFERDPGARRGIIGSISEADDRTLALGYASELEPIAGAREGGGARSVRGRVRALLAVPADAPLFVVSAMHLTRAGLEDCLMGAREASLDERPPFLVFLGRDTHSIDRVVRRAGVSERSRLIGATRRLGELFAAADALVVPGGVTPRDSTARLTSDALRCGVPVIAHPRAPGSELITPTHFGTAPIGLIVEDPSPGGWAGALAQAADSAWSRDARAAAASIAGTLSMDALIGRVEKALVGLARK